MANKLSLEECYQILELEPGASLDELKASWRLLSQIWHPDKHENGSKAQELALKRQQQLNEAYAQLEDYLKKTVAASSTFSKSSGRASERKTDTGTVAAEGKANRNASGNAGETASSHSGREQSTMQMNLPQQIRRQPQQNAKNRFHTFVS